MTDPAHVRLGAGIDAFRIDPAGLETLARSIAEMGAAIAHAMQPVLAAFDAAGVRYNPRTGLFTFPPGPNSPQGRRARHSRRMAGARLAGKHSGRTYAHH